MIVNKIIAILIFFILSPLFLVLFILILIEDGFPIIYKQKRIGFNNNEFWVYKFRTMKKETPDIPTHLVHNPKSYNTTIGPLLRRLSIDEIPQLINIVKGEMVFIGPRPALHNQDDLKGLRTEKGIHKLKPGLTGWAQVNGRDELSIPEKVKLDVYYLNNKSFRLNIKILFMTMEQLLFPKGVSH